MFTLLHLIDNVNRISKFILRAQLLVMNPSSTSPILPSLRPATSGYSDAKSAVRSLKEVREARRAAKRSKKRLKSPKKALVPSGSSTAISLSVDTSFEGSIIKAATSSTVRLQRKLSASKQNGLPELLHKLKDIVHALEVEEDVVPDEVKTQYLKKVEMHKHPLIWLAKNGDLSFMLWYLENSQHVDVHDVYNFETVLQVLLRQQLEHDDAYKEQRALLPRVVGELLQLGADPNRQDKFKRTPLWMAVLANEEDVIDSMVVHAQKAVEDHYRAGNSDILRRIANPNMESSWVQGSTRDGKPAEDDPEYDDEKVHKSSWHIAVDKELNGIRILEKLVSLQAAGSLLCYDVNRDTDEASVWEEYTYHSRRDAKRPSSQHQKCWVKEGEPPAPRISR